MVCGNAAMEAITSIASATATRFRMQQATNLSRPLPFPTVKETDSLRLAYDMAATRGRPSPTAINALMHKTGMGVKEIKGWFSDERKARGHAGHGWAPLREAAPSVEVRAHLPAPARRSLPSASYVPPHKEEYTEGEEGEYFEEEMKVDINPPWLEPPTGGVTLYAYDGEGHESSEYAILDTALLYDRADAESQDSWFG